jgi:excisionase family DNA binding protein
MTPAHLALVEAEARLVERLRQLGVKLADGDESGWVEYAQLAGALAGIVSQTRPGGGGEYLTTEQLADRLQISTKTLRRRAKDGQMEPVRLGKRGRGALRWPA